MSNAVQAKKRYGSLVAIKQDPANSRKWFFRCDCGAEVTKDAHSVSRGAATTCGYKCSLKDPLKRYTLETIQEAVKEYESGVSAKIIYSRLKCDQYTFKRLLKSQGVRVRKKGELLRIDLSNQRFGRLKAIRMSGHRGDDILWECECDCGKITHVATQKLRSGHTQSCGCKRREWAASTVIDLTNKRYGRLVVKERGDRSSSDRVQWKCVCDCGKETLVMANQLQQGRTKSCGCLVADATREALTKDISGHRSGRLVARRSTGKLNASNRYLWECDCDCGGTAIVDISSLLNQKTRSCGCLTSGDESIGSWLEGNFRLGDDDSHFYVFSMKNYSNLSKPGIANDINHRADEEYGELHDFIAMPRIDAWLIEQAVLQSTLDLCVIPEELKDWGGASELRQMTCEEVFKHALYYEEELKEIGRENFAIAYLPMTPSQREELEKIADS